MNPQKMFVADFLLKCTHISTNLGLNAHTLHWISKILNQKRLLPGGGKGEKDLRGSSQKISFWSKVQVSCFYCPIFYDKPGKEYLSRSTFSCNTFVAAPCSSQSQTSTGRVFALFDLITFFYLKIFNQDPILEEAVLKYARDNLALVKVPFSSNCWCFR